MKKGIVLLLVVILIVIGWRYTCENTGESPAIKYQEMLGALFEDQIDEVSTDGEGDVLIESPGVRIDLNTGGYVFLDEHDKIIRINRMDYVASLYKSENSPNDKFRTIEDLKEFLEDAVIESEYQLTNEYYLDENTLSLKYDKELHEGVSDKYDSYLIYIDTVYREVIFLVKRDSGYEEKQDDIIEEQEARDAIASAEIDWKMIGYVMDLKSADVMLSTVRTNSEFGSQVTDSRIVLAYVLSDESVEIYVDAHTAQIVGGDIYKTYDGE